MSVACDKLAIANMEVYFLGLHHYDDILRLQHRLVYEIQGRRSQAAVILCEHDPIITVGRSGSRAEIDCDDEQLKRRRLPVRWSNRGGGCQLHSPGQLLVYPLLPISPQAGLSDFFARVQRSVVGALGEFQVRAEAENDGRISTELGQIGTLGIAIRQWVSYHGLALNVSGTRDQFRIIRNRNAAVRFCSMEAVRQRPVSMAKVRESVARHFAGVFEPERVHYFSSHPMLKTQDKKHVPAGSLSH